MRINGWASKKLKVGKCERGLKAESRVGSQDVFLNISVSKGFSGWIVSTSVP
jgi:hypothetical protein